MRLKLRILQHILIILPLKLLFKVNIILMLYGLVCDKFSGLHEKKLKFFHFKNSKLYQI